MLKKLIQPFNLFIIIFLILAIVVRVYRIDELLAFHYDQGRDALVIWDLIKNGNWFLIGPTTGIEGIFRGPFYYYLITPFYFLGQGNPVFPAIFLIILSVFALWVMYKIAVEVGGKTAGIIALILAGFSYEIIYASRWLSNPTPMLFLSMGLVWSIFRIYEGNKKYWILLGLILGLSVFHFGSSGEIFYFPAILILFLLKKEVRPDRDTFLKSIGAFLISFLPLFIFDLKHNGILRNNILSFLGESKAFSLPSFQFLYERFSLILAHFTNLLFHEQFFREKVWLTTLLIIIIYFSKKVIIGSDKLKIVSFFLLSPVFGFLFFQGNYGQVYGYYLTGYYLIFFIFIGVFLGYFFKKSLFGKIFVIGFLIFYLSQNLEQTNKMLTTKLSGDNAIVLGNQLKAVEYIYSDAKDEKFNVDVYVPPVIPYSYDYLYTWKSNLNKVNEQVDKLYTLYEIDDTHPDRLNAWMKRQAGIGKIIKEEKFGGIVVQARERI